MLIGPAATKAELETFRQRILAAPDRYIAQPTLALSTCPTFVEAGLAPRHIDLRPYVLSGSDVELVPGGLTRVALRPDERHLGPRRLNQGPPMLCRTANELYWMARHIERAENTARLLDVTYRTSLLPYQPQEPGLAWAEPWSVPLISTGGATVYYKSYPELTAENVIRFMVLDAANPSSIYCC